MDITLMDLFATGCLLAAVVHSFMVRHLAAWANRFPDGSVQENLLHLLSEIEVVMGLWAGVYVGGLAVGMGPHAALTYMESRPMAEPVFVGLVMIVCATRPIMVAAQAIIGAVAQMLPLSLPMAYYVALLIIGPLLGSLITEPAAMTVVALTLSERYFRQTVSDRFRYLTLGVLFVNVSIGGTLTPYAAPPVVMVASGWGWDLMYMLQFFGWKAVMAVVCNASVVTWLLRREFATIELTMPSRRGVPLWLTGAHLVFLCGLVVTSHYVVVSVALFLFFLGVVTATREYQSSLRIREGLLVLFFLGGLVMLGEPQRWWLESALTHMSAGVLYWGAMGLTAITDNAALTYLGSQVPSLSGAMRYALVAGSVVGGGLTVIANAPNPVGFGILQPTFGENGIAPLRLLRAALLPTLIAAGCFLL